MPASTSVPDSGAGLLAALPLPPAVRTRLEAWIASPRPLGAARELAPGWRLEPDAAGGWLLWERVAAGARLWAAGDRCGALHVAAQWSDAGLRAAWFRLPDARWLELETQAAQHPLWGSCDALCVHEGGLPTAAGAGTPVGVLGALDYAALRWLPPFDRPGALPPGAGSAVLNFLARLATGQGTAALNYHGPYPTPALFATLRGSFAPEGDPARAQVWFTERQTALAFRGELMDNPVRWRPAPFAALRPRPELLLHWRDGIETAWVQGVPFRRAVAKGRALPSGTRVWPEDDGWSIGHVLLGRPAGRLYRLDAAGAVRQSAPPEARHDTSSETAPGALLDPRWTPVLLAWATLQAHPALAEAVTGLERSLRPAWHALPLRMAQATDDGLRVQLALATEYLRRREGEDAASLAMMLVSDVLEATTPTLLRLAQAAQEAAAPPADPQQWIAAGQAAQAAAQARLERDLPRLVAALARGEALPVA